MTKKESGFDELIYVLACIFSLGTVWIGRIMISTAIRKASH